MQNHGPPDAKQLAAGEGKRVILLIYGMRPPSPGPQNGFAPVTEGKQGTR
jgi:hypothetical protein